MNALHSNAHWLLRIALASVFLFHGFGKVANVSGFAEMMGLPVQVVLALIATYFLIVGNAQPGKAARQPL